MYIVKIFFRSLWEVVSIPLEAIFWALFLTFSIFFVMVPVLFVAGILGGGSSFFESFVMGYFGRRVVGQMSVRSFWRRFLVVVLAMVEVVAGAALSFLLFYWAGGLVPLFQSHPMNTIRMLLAVECCGAILFRRYVCDWVWQIFRMLRASLANRRFAGMIP